ARGAIPARLLEDSALFTASAAQFASAVDAFNNQAVVLLDADGCVTSWDEAAERLFKRTAAETVGLHVSTLYEPSDVEQGLPGKAVALALGASRHCEQGLRLRGDGTVFWANFLYMKADEPSTADVWLILVATDLSAAKRADHEIARLGAELQQRVADFET